MASGYPTNPHSKPTATPPQTELDRLRTMRAELTAFCNAVEAHGEHRTFLLAGVRNIIRKTDS